MFNDSLIVSDQLLPDALVRIISSATFIMQQMKKKKKAKNGKQMIKLESTNIPVQTFLALTVKKSSWGFSTAPQLT